MLSLKNFLLLYSVTRAAKILWITDSEGFKSHWIVLHWEKNGIFCGQNIYASCYKKCTMSHYGNTSLTDFSSILFVCLVAVFCDSVNIERDNDVVWNKNHGIASQIGCISYFCWRWVFLKICQILLWFQANRQQVWIGALILIIGIIQISAANPNSGHFFNPFF